MDLPESKQPTSSFDYDVYLSYLESDKWNELRNKRLAVDNYLCAICGNPHNLQVHHLLYPQILGTEHISQLVTLCNRCHSAIENRKKTAKYRNPAMKWYSNIQIWIRFKDRNEFNQNKEALRDFFDKRKYKGDNQVIIFLSESNEKCTLSLCDEFIRASLADCKDLADAGYEVAIQA